MVYTVSTTQNVVLYLSHRELIRKQWVLMHCVFSLYLSHRELILNLNDVQITWANSLYLSHRELIHKFYKLHANHPNFTFPIGNEMSALLQKQLL